MSRIRSAYGLRKSRVFVRTEPALFRITGFLADKLASRTGNRNTRAVGTMWAHETQPAALSEPTIRLSELEQGVTASVASIGSSDQEQDLELLLRLIEIGFVPGETLRVIAQGRPGCEPIAVRLGGTTFALRRIEADYIRVIRQRAVPS